MSASPLKVSLAALIVFASLVFASLVTAHGFDSTLEEHSSHDGLHQIQETDTKDPLLNYVDADDVTGHCKEEDRERDCSDAIDSPVCGFYGSGASVICKHQALIGGCRKDFKNACLACADKRIRLWLTGECHIDPLLKLHRVKKQRA